MSTSRAVLFVGGPDAGKSNYLFRVWLGIEAGNTPLMKDGLPSDLTHLNSGATALLGGEFAPHTSRDSGVACTIPIVVQGVSPGLHAELVVPDASGERWLDLYRKREPYALFDRYIREETGYMLFVRAASAEHMPALDWITSERLYEKELPETEVARLKDRTPTQVYLVDWLQIIRFRLNARSSAPLKPRLSVVVTAWDAVPAEQQVLPPRLYLERNFPLLAQFLESDLHGFDAEIFGVTVAGGDLKNAEFRQEYLEESPAERGYVTIEERRASARQQRNIALPIMWALGL